MTDIISRASRRLKKFNAPLADLVSVYTSYIRHIMEYACQVWHSSISRQLCVQKRACRIIIGYQNYDSYSKTLQLLGIPSLESRRNTLLLKFGNKLMNSNKFRHICSPSEIKLCSKGA